MKKNIAQQFLCHSELTDISGPTSYPKFEIEEVKSQASHNSNSHSYHSFIFYLASFISDTVKSGAKGIQLLFSFVDTHRQKTVFSIKLEKTALC